MPERKLPPCPQCGGPTVEHLVEKDHPDLLRFTMRLWILGCGACDALLSEPERDVAALEQKAARFIRRLHRRAQETN